MGLLDDAIREHLELKRQRGADSDEVTRLEREALGPVVRGEELATDAASADAEPLSPEYEPMAADPAAEHEYEHAAGEVDFAPAPVEPEPHPAAEPPPHAGQPTEEFDVESVHAQEASHPEPEPEPVAEHPPAPAPASREAAAPPPPEPEPPAREHAEDRHADEEAQPGEHDVLEDTPEFLQETPEHDRLWFEQAPPQEFDFDK
jgi:hypothetical protein